jgi:hypothetical protein
MESPLAMALAAVVCPRDRPCRGPCLGRRRELARREQERAEARDEAGRILERAKEEAESLRKAGELRGREEAFRLREEWEREEARRREDLERPSAAWRSAPTPSTGSSTS